MRARRILENLFNQTKYTKANLKKDIVAGNIEGSMTDYGYRDDPYSKTNKSGFYPVKLSEEPNAKIKDGIMYLPMQDLVDQRTRLTTSSDATGKTVTLFVHSNLYYVFRKIS